MSVILFDLADKKHDLQLSSWVWLPLVELIKDSEANIDKDRLELMEQKLWFTITQDEARKIAAYIRPIASRLKEGEVIRTHKTVGPEPPAG